MADTIWKTSESYVTTRERPMHAPRLHAGVNTPQVVIMKTIELIITNHYPILSSLLLIKKEKEAANL